jgi:hypothetical protein
MRFATRTAIVIVLGLVALLFTALNPNFSMEDLYNPFGVFGKMSWHTGFSNSGMMYLLSYSVFGGCIVALLVATLTGRLFRQPPRP